MTPTTTPTVTHEMRGATSLVRITCETGNPAHSFRLDHVARAHVMTFLQHNLPEVWLTNSDRMRACITRDGEDLLLSIAPLDRHFSREMPFRLPVADLQRAILETFEI